METFVCKKCKMIFYAEGPSACIYCNHVYCVWVTYKERSKKEVETILKEAVNGKV
jgi:hypothetical protein